MIFLFLFFRFFWLFFDGQNVLWPALHAPCWLQTEENLLYKSKPFRSYRYPVIERPICSAGQEQPASTFRTGHSNLPPVYLMANRLAEPLYAARTRAREWKALYYYFSEQRLDHITSCAQTQRQSESPSARALFPSHRLLILLRTQASILVDNAHVKLSRTLDDSLAVKGGHVVRNLRAILPAAQEREGEKGGQMTKRVKTFCLVGKRARKTPWTTARGGDTSHYCYGTQREDRGRFNSLTCCAS